MFIFDNKANISINSNELIFKSEYYCNFSPYFKIREFLEMEALQLSGEHFEGYLSKLITKQVMLELSQRNCFTKLDGILHPEIWLFGIPFHPKPVLFQNLYKLEDNYIGILPPKAEFSLFQVSFSHRFQLYVHEAYLNQLCQTLDLPEAKKFLNNSAASVVICSSAKIRYLQEVCFQLYHKIFHLESQKISLRRKTLNLNFIKQQLKEEIVKKFLLTLAEAKEIKPTQNTIRRTSILKKAEEMMRKNIYSDLTILDICQELNVSQRTFEYIFKDFYEISPKNYFKKLRLNALRQFLHQNPQTTSIYETAEDFGFYHRGQLARDYYQLFGELPSETLKK